MGDKNTSVQPDNIEIGRTIRSLRERQMLSVRTLAKRSGFSPSFISQVENGQASPSIASMQKIARALGVSLSEFFARRVGNDKEPTVTRAGEGNELTSEWSHATIRALGPVWADRKLSPFLLTLDPAGKSGASPAEHQGEAFAYVVEGTTHLQLSENTTHQLQAGDSVHLPAGVEYQWENHSQNPVSILLVTSIF